MCVKCIGIITVIFPAISCFFLSISNRNKDKQDISGGQQLLVVGHQCAESLDVFIAKWF